MWKQDKYLRRISKSIDNAMLVSFDIYDTLLFRTVSVPDRIFYYTGMLMNERYPGYDIPADVFAGMRAEAETIARGKAWDTAQYEDVTLEEIYAEFNLGEHFRTHAKECELETETQHIFINSHMADFMRYCHKQGKRIAVISDTFFSKAQVIRFLKNCAFDIQIVELFVVSSEYRALKHNGKLFHKLLEEMPDLAPNQILHIGDNRKADIDGASIAGIPAEHYGATSCAMLHPISIEMTGYGTVESIMSLRKRAGSLVPGEHENQVDTVLFTAGTSVFGPLYVAFAEWIINQCVKDNISTVLAFMREGELLAGIIGRTAHNRGVNVAVKPVYISRRTTEIAGIGKVDGGVIDEYIHRNRLSVSTLFSIFYLDINKTQFSADGECTIEQYKERGRFDGLLSYFKQPDTLAEINEKANEQRALLIEYIQSLTNGEAAITVDVGFRGTMQACLTNIKANGNSGLLHLLLMGLPYSNRFLLEGVPIRGWLGYGNENRYIIEQVYQRVQVLEAVTNADIGTTLEYKKENGKIIPILEDIGISEENKRRKRIIWQGIHCYQDCWFELAGNKPYLTEKVIADRKGFLGILSRFFLMPAHDEASVLGAMCYDESLLINEETTIIRASDFESLNNCDDEGQFINACIARQCQRHVYWPEGVVAVKNPYYFLKMHTKLTSNRNYADILEFLHTNNIFNKRIAVYGAGAAGRELTEVLYQSGIMAECIVDINHTLQGRCFSGVKVISPEESIGIADIYVITPLRFKQEIRELLNSILTGSDNEPHVIAVTEELHKCLIR